MKCNNVWTYRQYHPYFFDVGDIYINRLCPYKNSFHIEWLCLDDKAVYTVFYRKRDCGEYIKAGETENTEFDVFGLTEDYEYEVFVQCGDKKSRIRLLRTGECIGTIVNYLHPNDEVYSFSGHYLCSPSLVHHPGGYLLASMDVYGKTDYQNLTLIFRSDDNGETWHYVSELFPCFWAKMFIHKDELYVLSVSTKYGDLLIGKSADGGKTFGTPTVLLRGSGRKSQPGVHKNPQNIVYYKGRIYETLEWGREIKEIML